MEPKVEIICNYLVSFKGKLTILTYRSNGPVVNGQSDRDSYYLSQIPCSKDVTEDTWINDIVQVQKWNGFNSNTIKEECKILAKNRIEWDWSKPVGKRKVSEVQTSNFKTLFTQYNSHHAKVS